MGFSFVEVILVMGLSSSMFLFFLNALSFNQKLQKDETQALFFNLATSTSIVDRGLQMYKSNPALIFGYLNDSIGKRSCTLKSISDTRPFDIIFPKYIGLRPNFSEVASLRAFGNKLAVGMNSATSSDPDIMILDISDINNFKILSTLNTGPGIADMALQGHYLFIANTSVNAQFQIVDILNPNLPILVTSLKIPGSISSDSKRNPVITSISSNQNGRIFLGSQKSDLGEIFRADFNGTNFSYINSYNPGAIVNDLFTEGDGLWATSPSDNELFHYNASGTVDYTFNADGGSGNGKRIDLIGKNLKILGRTFGRDELVQIDGPTEKIGGTVEDVLIGMDAKMNTYVLILASGAGFSKFQIWSTKNDPPVLDKVYSSIVLPYTSNRIACLNGNIIIGTASSSLPLIILNQ